MSKLKLSTAFLSATAAATLMCGATSAANIADPNATLRNDQASLDADIWSFAGGESEAALGGNATAVALGNTASAEAPAGFDLQAENDQALSGRVDARSELRVYESGPLTSGAITYGNSFSVESGGDNLGANHSQSVESGSFLTSRALIEAASYAETATVTATLGANTVTMIGDGYYAGMDVDQRNGARVAVESVIDAYDADILAAVGATVGVVNNADLFTTGDGELYGVQSNTGDGHARTLMEIGGTFAAAGTSTITGNNLNMINEGGVGAMQANQTNHGEMRAETYMGFEMFPGSVSGASGAIGNAASATTVGPRATMDFVQHNTGPVIADTLVAGVSGGVASATSSAYGNNVNGTLCSECGGALNATNHQTNSGPVRARAHVYAGNAQMVNANSIAAGNAATFIVGAPGH